MLTLHNTGGMGHEFSTLEVQSLEYGLQFQVTNGTRFNGAYSRQSKGVVLSPHQVLALRDQLTTWLAGQEIKAADVEGSL